MTHLRGHDIVMLSLLRFDDPIASANYAIAKELARHNRVFYVDHPYTQKDCATMGGTPAHARRKPLFNRSSTGIIDTDVPNLKVVITPPVYSINWMPEGPLYRAALRVNESIIRRRIRQVIEANGLREIIYINSHNFHYPKVAKGLPTSLTIHHCIDPLVVPYDRKHGLVSEMELVRESDAVICTSHALTEEKRRTNPHSYFVPNAANVDHTRKALDPALPVEERIAALRKPVIGFFGAIERRMDYPMLEAVMAAHPEWTFAYVGPVEAEYMPDGFRSAKNAFFTGPMPYEMLPAALKGFDVATIPYKKDDASRSIFPLKLFEYLGAGKPVVSGDFNPDLKDFTGDTVAYAGGAEAFAEAIQASLRESTPEDIEARLDVARANTWERRGEQFANILAHRLETKTGASLPTSTAGRGRATRADGAGSLQTATTDGTVSKNATQCARQSQTAGSIGTSAAARTLTPEDAQST